MLTKIFAQLWQLCKNASFVIILPDPLYLMKTCQSVMTVNMNGARGPQGVWTRKTVGLTPLVSSQNQKCPLMAVLTHTPLSLRLLRAFSHEGLCCRSPTFPCSRRRDTLNVSWMIIASLGNPILQVITPVLGYIISVKEEGRGHCSP